METPILVVDANREFGILIRQSLEESGRYSVTLATSGMEALERSAEQQFELAIIDFDLPDMAGPELIHQLRSATPSLPLVVIPYGADAGAELKDLPVEGVLQKPFYLPELPTILEDALSSGSIGQVRWERAEEDRIGHDPEEGPASREQGPSEEGTPALSGQTIYPARLETLLHESPAEAGLILGEEGVVARSGLSAGAAQEVIRQLDRHEGQGDTGALARYVRMSSSDEDRLLYAMRLSARHTLAVLYPAGIAFGEVRRATRGLADNLRSSPRPPAPEPPSGPGGIDDEGPEAIGEHPAAMPSDWVPESSLSAAQEAILKELAEADLPPPDPSPGPEPTPAKAEGLTLPTDWIPAESPSLDLLDHLEERPPGGTPPPSPSSGPGGSEPRQPSLTFYIALFPRFPQHKLTGGLAAQLEDWTRRVCLAWDWRPERLLLSPEYLLLQVNLKPQDAPAAVVRQLQQDLSRRILDQHPPLRQDLPSGRFWAPDALLTAGPPPSEADIRDFLASTRRSQGLGS